MKTQPSSAELELERTRNIELRLSKFHVEQKDPITLIEAKKAQEENLQEAMTTYEKRGNKIYERILQLEVNNK